MPDGSGRIGPSLIGPQHIHERTATDVGLFEAVLGGSLGAMQSFRDRLTQDEILAAQRLRPQPATGRILSDAPGWP